MYFSWRSYASAASGQGNIDDRTQQYLPDVL